MVAALIKGIKGARLELSQPELTQTPFLPFKGGFNLMDKARFPELLRAIYESVDALEAMFPGRHFTPDGHLVGSLGEALASYHYGIELSGASAQCHDGVCGRRNVQVKATQGNRISLSSELDHLLVLRLKRDGTFVEEYNGPGSLVWSLVSHKPRPKNGQYQVSLAALGRLMKTVNFSERLKPLRK